MNLHLKIIIKNMWSLKIHRISCPTSYKLHSIIIFNPFPLNGGSNDIIIIIMQKLKRIIQIEKRRYQKKGVKNIIIAVGLLLGIEWVSLEIGRTYWPQHIEDKLQFIFIGSVFCHIAIQLFSFIVHLPGYLGWSNYYAQHLINKKSSRPWQRKNWIEMRSKAINNLLLNQLIVYPLAVYLSNKNGIRVRFDRFPSFLELFVQVIIVYMVQDFFFYWGHRLFHSLPFFYKMHKIHHEYDTLYTWVTEYFHPLDFLVANLLPSAMGFILLGDRAHCFTFFYWICWKVLISTEGHSGYEFKWAPTRILPFVTGPSYHDHHHSHNVGNYSGSCYLWDLMLDTNIPYMDDFLKQ